MAASSVLLLQIVLVFLYDVLLASWIEAIFAFLSEIAFVRYILYYGGVALTIAVFGGIVYIIQKKIFAPEKVALRRLKDNKCPRCSFSITRKEHFCPSCGLELQKMCGHCGKMRLVHPPHCEHCGKTEIAPQPDVHQ
jgi:hypothetical protein